jgi:hypothetical protein
MRIRRLRGTKGSEVPVLSRVEVRAFTLLLGILAVLALSAAPASAVNTHIFSTFFGGKGAGAGQVEEPSGVAVDDSEAPLDGSVGDVYALNGAGSLEKFDSEGHLLREWPVSGQAVAVGPTGTVFVGESGAVQEYTAEGVAIGGPLSLEDAGTVSDVAVNATGDVYVSEQEIRVDETLAVRGYGAAGEALGVFDEEAGGLACSLTVDRAAGEVYVSQRLATGVYQVRGFDAGGVQLAAFAPVGIEVLDGIAFDAQSGALYTPSYTPETSAFAVEVLVPPVPGPVVSGESASGVEPAGVLVHATIDAEGAEARYRVGCGRTATYDHWAV